MNPDTAAFAYMDALSGYPMQAITDGIRKFLRGECEEVSKKFCPHPPELASIVRGCIPSRPEGRPTGKLYSYKAPKSKCLERNIGKDHARRLVDQGVFPRGSIWLPGDFKDSPQTGDLYAPDPEWQPAKPFEPKVA